MFCCHLLHLSVMSSACSAEMYLLVYACCPIGGVGHSSSVCVGVNDVRVYVVSMLRAFHVVLFSQWDDGGCAWYQEARQILYLC